MQKYLLSLGLCFYFFGGELKAQAIEIVIAKEIITLDDEHQSIEAIAVKDGLILELGSLKKLQALYPQASINTAAKDSVLIPGFIEHHIHPFLAAVTMNADIIAIDDWSLPNYFSAGVRDREGYFQRLREAASADQTEQPFISWGYHHYFHGTICE